jgi:hypothetical protein
VKGDVKVRNVKTKIGNKRGENKDVKRDVKTKM